MLNIYIDADGCPVREETFKVAERYKLSVFVVANKPMGIPLSNQIEMVVVTGNFDAADDWIVEKSEAQDIVITADILLANRLVQKQVRVLGHKGIEWTEDNIGSAVANRELMQNLRHMGEIKGGPSPMNKTDRSAFLGKLDQIIQNIQRKNKITKT